MIDFHTHGINPVATKSIQVLENLNETLPSSHFCLGMHPWNSDKFDSKNFKEDLHFAQESILFKGVGEIGLDKVRGPKIEIQYKVLIQQIELATKHKVKTLFIHSVKSFNEIYKALISSNFTGNIVIHDFHGHINNIHQFEKKFNTFISVNQNFLKTEKNLETIRQLGATKVLLETDIKENQIISDNYQVLSSILQIDELELASIHNQIFESF